MAYRGCQCPISGGYCPIAMALPHKWGALPHNGGLGPITGVNAHNQRGGTRSSLFRPQPIWRRPHGFTAALNLYGGARTTFPPPSTNMAARALPFSALNLYGGSRTSLPPPSTKMTAPSLFSRRPQPIWQRPLFPFPPSRNMAAPPSVPTLFRAPRPIGPRFALPSF